AEGSTSTSHSAVFSVGGDSEGDSISQRFFSTANQVYMLDFDAGVFGTPDSSATLQLRVQVTGNSTLLDQTITPPVAGTSDPSSSLTVTAVDCIPQMMASTDSARDPRGEGAPL